MNELRSFSNEEFGELNILEIDGKPYFPATQCARTVGHENPARAVRKFCKGVTQMVTPTEGGNQTVNFIPEGDLYRLIVHSRLPAAERFEKWVFEEVLPSIRQSGGYEPDMAQMIREEVRHAMQEVMDEIIRSAEMDAGCKRRRRHGSKSGIIANLDAPTRQEIDLMLESRKYTYRDICQILERDYGIRVSKSSLGRYALQEDMEQEPGYAIGRKYPNPEVIGMLIRLLMSR